MVVYFQIYSRSLTSYSMVYHDNYTETMKRSHMDGGNNGAQSFSLSAHTIIPLQPVWSMLTSPK